MAQQIRMPQAHDAIVTRIEILASLNVEYPGVTGSRPHKIPKGVKGTIEEVRSDKIKVQLNYNGSSLPIEVKKSVFGVCFENLTAKTG